MRGEEHPEEAIDRALLARLDPGERARLDEHLAVCAACAIHVSHGPRFAHEVTPTARDANLDRRAIEATLARLQSGKGRQRSTRWITWAAAGVALIAGAAGAAAFVRTGDREAPGLVPAAGRVPSPPRHLPVVEEPSPPTLLTPAEAAPVAAPAPTRVIATATQLFQRAADLRRQGRSSAALALYGILQKEYPQTREGRLSFALAGQVLLDSRRPADALAQFDRYLRLPGNVDLDEEALAGRAHALEQLGRATEAASGWQALIERHPRSVYAERARKRLRALGSADTMPEASAAGSDARLR